MTKCKSKYGMDPKVKTVLTTGKLEELSDQLNRNREEEGTQRK